MVQHGSPPLECCALAPWWCCLQLQLQLCSQTCGCFTSALMPPFLLLLLRHRLTGVGVGFVVTETVHQENLIFLPLLPTLALLCHHCS